MTPTISPAKTPAQLEFGKPQPVQPFNDIDFTKNGLYSKSDIDQLQEYLAFPKKKEALAYSLTQQATNIGYENQITPMQLFPNLASETSSLRNMLLGPFLALLAKWGSIASIIICIYALFCAAYAVTKYILSFPTIRRTATFCAAIFWACCPGAYHGREGKQTKSLAIEEGQTQPENENPPEATEMKPKTATRTKFVQDWT